MGPVRALIAPIVVAPLVISSLPAFAQGNPSADQIINSLKPSGNLVTGGTRGIRLSAPNNDASGQPGAAPTQQPRVASGKPGAGSTTSAPAANPTVNLTVNFAYASAELTPDAIHTLDELGRALSSKDL